MAGLSSQITNGTPRRPTTRFVRDVYPPLHPGWFGASFAGRHQLNPGRQHFRDLVALLSKNPVNAFLRLSLVSAVSAVLLTASAFAQNRPGPGARPTPPLHAIGTLPPPPALPVITLADGTTFTPNRAGTLTLTDRTAIALNSDGPLTLPDGTVVNPPHSTPPTGG